MSIIETDVTHAERSLASPASDVAPQALAAVARFGAVGTAVLGSLLWIALTIFGL